MTIGSKSLLFGVHQFALHPLFVAAAWWKLYGFPLDPRLWVAFVVHDWGYWGKHDIDGEDGKSHPVLGGLIMGGLFGGECGFFTVRHSRAYARALGMPISRLCVADKLACAITPAWLYVPCALASGEMDEYLANSRKIKVDFRKEEAAFEAARKSGNAVSEEWQAYWRICRNQALRQMRDAANVGDAWKWKHAISQYMREEVAVLMEEAGVSA